MKKYISLCAALAFGAAAFAQKSEVTSAYMNFSHYQKEKDPAELASAKTHIDNATAHPDTKEDAKTWVYRGNIYLALYQKEFTEKMNTHKDITDGAKKQSLAFLETPTANLIEASNSYLKAKSLDTKKVYYDDQVKPGLGNCNYYLQNAAISFYNQNQFAEAVPMFEMAADIAASDKKFDTLLINNIAVSAYNAKMWDKASANYRKLADAGYGKGGTWVKLAQISLETGDSAKYKATIAEGLKKFPADQDLLVEDVNIKMKEGHDKEAIDELSQLVAQRPNDPDLNLVVGNVYDRLANPKKADGTDAPKPANYEELLAQAIVYYKKSIELKPNNYDANYNLGVLYYNQAVYYYNRSLETIADAAKYASMWEKPLPDAAKYLEEAHRINPKEMDPLVALRATYSQMSDNENYKRIKEEIKKLQSGQ